MHHHPAKWENGVTPIKCTLSLQEEQRLASSRQAKEQAEQQLQERAKAATDITCGVDQVRHTDPSSPLSHLFRVQQSTAR